MYLKDDLNRMLFTALKGSSQISISGGVYIEDRPLLSEKEDIIVNTITASQSLPQTATSNVNIYVPDKTIKFNGKTQYVQNAERIEAIVRKAIGVIEAIKSDGIDVYASNYTTMQERAINQHCANIRVQWYICRPNP